MALSWSGPSVHLREDVKCAALPSPGSGKKARIRCPANERGLFAKVFALSFQSLKDNCFSKGTGCKVPTAYSITCKTVQESCNTFPIPRTSPFSEVKGETLSGVLPEKKEEITNRRASSLPPPPQRVGGRAGAPAALPPQHQAPPPPPHPQTARPRGRTDILSASLLQAQPGTASQSPPRPGPPRYLLPRYPLAAAFGPGFASPPSPTWARPTTPHT